MRLIIIIWKPVAEPEILHAANSLATTDPRMAAVGITIIIVGLACYPFSICWAGRAPRLAELAAGALGQITPGTGTTRLLLLFVWGL